MGTIRYTREDLELFSKASHDKSRLHMSEQYACQTIYGEPIVFGILGAFASLCALSDRHGQQIATTALDYRLPLYMGVDYQIETNESAQGRAQGHRIKIGGLGRMANSAFGGKLNLCGTCSHLFTMFVVYLVVDNKYNVYVR